MRVANLHFFGLRHHILVIAFTYMFDSKDRTHSLGMAHNWFELNVSITRVVLSLS